MLTLDIIVIEMTNFQKFIKLSESLYPNTFPLTQGDNEEVDCVICGMACTDKNAVRHMERCYNKV